MAFPQTTRIISRTSEGARSERYCFTPHDLVAPHEQYSVYSFQWFPSESHHSRVTVVPVKWWVWELTA